MALPPFKTQTRFFLHLSLVILALGLILPFCLPQAYAHGYVDWKLSPAIYSGLFYCGAMGSILFGLLSRSPKTEVHCTA